MRAPLVCPSRGAETRLIAFLGHPAVGKSMLVHPGLATENLPTRQPTGTVLDSPCGARAPGSRLRARRETRPRPRPDGSGGNRLPSKGLTRSLGVDRPMVLERSRPYHLALHAGPVYGPLPAARTGTGEMSWRGYRKRPRRVQGIAAGGSRSGSVSGWPPRLPCWW